jgi:DNA replication protein DnaC
MNIPELQRSLRKLRLGSMALSLETRLIEAQSEPLPHIDFLSALVTDELTRRGDRLIARRVKQAAFRDAGRTLDGFDFTFNPKMNRRLVFELTTHELLPIFLQPRSGRGGSFSH